MIEEQALCRIHRVGQKRNVTTIRYLMKDSFEEVSSLPFLSTFLSLRLLQLSYPPFLTSL